jgi:Asp-tRNA(Asn)/Glu-tRNA(Gln) amidotransferase A subunit family amidase
MTGIKPFAPSLDTLGCFARDVADVELLRTALTGDAYRPLGAPDHRLRVGVYRSVDWTRADASSQQAVLDVARVLARQADLRDVDPLPQPHATADAQRIIMAFEAARSLGHEYRTHRNALSARLAELLDAGSGIGYADYEAAQQVAAATRDALRVALADRDVLITPSAPGEAPVGLDGTGDPAFNRLWTMFGVPAVTIPVADGPNGLPIGVQLIGPWDQDRELLTIAQWLDARVRGDVR